MALWTEALEERLVNLVQDYPWLYAVNSRGFRDKHKKTNSWREIATSLPDGIDADAAHKKWDALRDKYRRLRQKDAMLPPSGSSFREAESQRPDWALFTVLHSFLQPHTNHRRRGGDSFNVESAVAENGNAATVLMEDVGEQSQSQVVLDGIDASQLDVVFEDSQASNSQASNASSPADAEVTAAVGNGQPGTVAANRSAATEAAARPEPDRRPVGSQPATLERPPARPQQRSPTPGPSGAPDVRRPGPSLATPRRPQPSKRTPAVAGASQQSWQRELVDCWKQAKATEKDRVSCFLEYLGTLMRNVSPDDLDDVEDKVLRVVRSFR